MDKSLMDQQFILKNRLAEAIQNNNRDEIERISLILNIPAEQIKYFDKGLTGYPSIDKMHLKNYKDGAEQRVAEYICDKTVWAAIKEELVKHFDIPAIEYFGKITSREELIVNVEKWAKAFKSMGVVEDEVIPFYGPFSPEIVAMTFALNMIGATPYFIKLSIKENELREHTEDSRFAVVFDEMWSNVSSVFTEPRFEKVIVSTAYNGMPSPKKEIVSFLSYMKAKKEKSLVPREKKYIWLDDALNEANNYTGILEAPFKPNRTAFITSSSGTSLGGVVKSPEATNEKTIAQLIMGKESGAQYHPGDRVLTNFPPTAATSLNCFCLMSLYNGCTMALDPRVSEKDFYNQILTLKPTSVISTGSMWETFFNIVESEIRRGKRFNFSYANAWCIGGEGTSPKKLKRWNSIMRCCNAPHDLLVGYGSSEFFSIITADVVHNISNINNTKPVTAVGIPYAGMSIGAYDENGCELSYNQRGEIIVTSKSAMKQYYKNEKKTNDVKINDDTIRQGDLGEIDENGFIYIWGRVDDKITTSKGNMYLFDIANKILEFPQIIDAMVFKVDLGSNNNTLKAHIAFDSSVKEKDKAEILKAIDYKLSKELPEDVIMVAYKDENGMLPYSPTTLKKDRNKMSSDTTGYNMFENGELISISFKENETNEKIYDIIKEDNKPHKKACF